MKIVKLTFDCDDYFLIKDEQFSANIEKLKKLCKNDAQWFEIKDFIENNFNQLEICEKIVLDY